MVQNIPGILIVPRKTNSVEKLAFELWMSYGTSANPFFFSNPAIRKAIETYPRHSSSQSTQLGELSYLLHSEKLIESLLGKKVVEKNKQWRVENNLGEKPVYGYEYFPYDAELEKNKAVVGKDRTHFSNKGIALFAERIALRELLRLAPNAVLLPSLWMTDMRINQLKRRGMEITRAKQLLSAREVFQAINKHIHDYRVRERLDLSSQRLAVAVKSGRKLRKRK